jgi:hypothetical protein
MHPDPIAAPHTARSDNGRDPRYEMVRLAMGTVNPTAQARPPFTCGRRPDTFPTLGAGAGIPGPENNLPQYELQCWS